MYYPIKLDKDRTLRYGMRAIINIEKKIKKPIVKVLTETPTVEEIFYMTLEGLLHEDKTLTLEKVIDMIDEHSTFGKVYNSVINALSDCMMGNSEAENAQETGEPAGNEKNE